MSDDRKNNATAMQYIGLGTQLMALIGIGVWGGYKLDQQFHFKALFVIIFPLIGLSYSLWQLIRTLNKK